MGTNISYPFLKALLKIILLFPRWDMDPQFPGEKKPLLPTKTTTLTISSKTSFMYQVSESGFNDMESIPCSMSHFAKSGWSDGPWPQIPTYLGSFRLGKCWEQKFLDLFLCWFGWSSFFFLGGGIRVRLGVVCLWRCHVFLWEENGLDLKSSGVKLHFPGVSMLFSKPCHLIESWRNMIYQIKWRLTFVYLIK